MGKKILGVFVAAITLVVAGCGKTESGSSGVTAQANYAWIQANVLDRSCVSCHNDGKHPKDVNLQRYDAIMASKVVVANDASKSTLFTEIDGGHMPLHAPPLPKDLGYAVRDWIAAGAPR